MFLPTLATEASIRKYFGNNNVVISIQRAAFRAKIDMNLNFFMSASKFFPNFEAYRIPPSIPNPSFKTHVKAAAAIVPYAAVPPQTTNRLCILSKFIIMKAVPPILAAIVNSLYYLATDSGYPFGRNVVTKFVLASIIKVFKFLAS